MNKKNIFGSDLNVRKKCLVLCGLALIATLSVVKVAFASDQMVTISERGGAGEPGYWVVYTGGNYTTFPYGGYRYDKYNPGPWNVEGPLEDEYIGVIDVHVTGPSTASGESIVQWHTNELAYGGHFIPNN